MWFGQKNYADKLGTGPYRIADAGCFLTAFCNLEQKFGKEIDPPSLNRLFIERGIYLASPEDGAGSRDDLGWNSITAYDGQIHPVSINNSAQGAWPSTNNAIVKFAYTSPKTSHPMTHFCLVADPHAQTIVDSWDGIIRSPGYYGQPVAWAEYAETVPQPVVVPPPAPGKSTAISGQIIKLQKGDTISAIAVRYGLSTADLLNHNGLSWADARTLPVGFELRLPINNPAPAVETGYTIEALDAPRPMHVSNPKGATKWGFANVKAWTDLASNGTVAANTNVDIYGIATVLIGKTTAAYYLDKLAFGDYKTNGGHLTNAIGYNWSDLADGHYTAPQPAPEAAKPVPAAPPIPRAPAPVPPPQPDVKPAPPQADAPATNPNEYKATYKAFPEPKNFVLLNTLMAKEFDGRRNDKQVLKNQAVPIAGTFIHGQTLYGRPHGAVVAGSWFGIPMDQMISEDDLYNTQVALPEKVAMHYVLSNKEKIVVALSRFLASIHKYTDALTKKK